MWVSVLYREPKLLKVVPDCRLHSINTVSVLYREPKLLKGTDIRRAGTGLRVSVLYREPKLLKGGALIVALDSDASFSALP